MTWKQHNYGKWDLATRIPDFEIRPENIIPGSPLFIPFKWEGSKGKGKHSKNIKISVSNSN